LLSQKGQEDALFRTLLTLKLADYYRYSCEGAEKGSEEWFRFLQAAEARYESAYTRVGDKSLRCSSCVHATPSLAPNPNLSVEGERNELTREGESSVGQIPAPSNSAPLLIPPLSDVNSVAKNNNKSNPNPLSLSQNSPEKETIRWLYMKLRVVLQFCVFLYEQRGEKSDVTRACQIGREAFDEMIEALRTHAEVVTEIMYKDITMLMQLLWDNLTLWSTLGDEEEEKEKGANEK
jgi:hypothetical protein